MTGLFSPVLAFLINPCFLYSFTKFNIEAIFGKIHGVIFALKSCKADEGDAHPVFRQHRSRKHLRTGLLRGEKLTGALQLASKGIGYIYRTKIQAEDDELNFLKYAARVVLRLGTKCHQSRFDMLPFELWQDFCRSLRAWMSEVLASAFYFNLHQAVLKHAAVAEHVI